MSIKRFESIDEIRGVVGYVDRVRKGEYEFAKFVGYYRFADRKKWIRCAKLDCNQPHGFGFVVSTTSGAITAIGHVCGEAVFGHLYQAAHRALDVELQRQFEVDALAESLSRLPQYRQQADELKHARRGTLWFERAERSFQSCIPRRLTGEIYDLASRGDGSISRDRERTKEDVPPKGARGASDFVTETFGVIDGVGALASPSPVRILNDRVLQEMPVFQNVTAGWLVDQRPQRQRFKTWILEVPHALEEAAKRLRQAVAFFETSNLRVLAHVARLPSDRDILSRLVWNDAAGIVELEPPRRYEDSRTA